MTEKPLVLVRWDDAWQDQENFATAHGITVTHGPLPVQTLGWVIVDDAEGLSIVNEISNQNGKEEYRGRTFIPRAMIKSITPYKLSKPRNKKSEETPSSDGGTS